MNPKWTFLEFPLATPKLQNPISNSIIYFKMAAKSFWKIVFFFQYFVRKGTFLYDSFHFYILINLHKILWCISAILDENTFWKIIWLQCEFDWTSMLWSFKFHSNEIQAFTNFEDFSIQYGTHGEQIDTNCLKNAYAAEYRNFIPDLKNSKIINTCYHCRHQCMICLS